VPVEELITETVEYRLLLVEPESSNLLVIREPGGYRLPSVRILVATRPAEQLQRAIRAEWNLHVILLDFLPGLGMTSVYAIAEVLMFDGRNRLERLPHRDLPSIALEDQQRAKLESILAGDSMTIGPLSRIGWIDEAIAWVEAETGKKLASRESIEQYNAGGAFSLLRFHTEDDWAYWLKATGEPNAHEPRVTAFLSERCGDYLPQIVSLRPEWNAWLMSGEATRVDMLPEDPFELFALLEDAVECMAELQMKTSGYGLDLLDAGAFDQGVEVMQKHSAELFDFLEEAMDLQTSIKAPRLEKKRLGEIRASFDHACQSMEDLGIEECIVHGDLNCGNIVTGIGHCQFIDWCEAYLGNPLISLQHLLLLNKVKSSEIKAFSDRILKRRYLDVWTQSCDTDALREGFLYMPMLAIGSTLYGRGDWLRTPQRNDPHRQSYARSLARHMDRAAREPQLEEALCS
jgi:hypothetical protein